ncbi:MAG: hypothetical protein V4563_17620 [Pseudomonadota bacterium]
MTIKRLDIDPANVDVDGICEAQTTGAAGNLILNGALCDLGTPLRFDIGDSYSSGCGGVQLVFDSSGDINTVVFTITGLDANGNAQTATVTGVTTTEVETTTYWSQITRIAASAAVTSSVTVGTVDEVVTRTIPINWSSLEPYTVAVLGVVGTINFDIQEGFDETREHDILNWYSFQAGKTAAIVSDVQRHATAVRLVVNSYTDTAELQFYVNGQ